MLYSLDAILCLILCIGIVWVAFLIRKNQKLQDFNTKISGELHILIQDAIAMANRIPEDNAHGGGVREPEDLLRDPVLLSTMVTVIVSKYGSLVLSAEDFHSVRDEDSVSVYIDRETSELTLSLNHGLSEEDRDISWLKYVNDTDDETYH